MAKKTSVPAPPRPVQAPRKRVDPGPSKRRYLILAGVAALLILAIAALAAFAPRLGGSADAKAAMREAGCSYRIYPATTSKHVAETEKVKYNSFPPTNGDMTDEMVVFGFYAEPVDDKQLVHNLEHGAIAIQFGPAVAPATIAQLEALYREDPTGVVVAQLPSLGDKIAVAAWNAPTPSQGAGKQDLGHGILALCPRFDQKAFETFVDKHRYQGPERMPRETLEPGQ